MPPRDERELTTLSPEPAELVARLAEVDRAAVGPEADVPETDASETDVPETADPGAAPRRAAHRYVPGRHRVLAAAPAEPATAPVCSTEAPAAP